MKPSQGWRVGTRPKPGGAAGSHRSPGWHLVVFCSRGCLAGRYGLIPPRSGGDHRWVSLLPFAKVLITLTDREGGRGN